MLESHANGLSLAAPAPRVSSPSGGAPDRFRCGQTQADGRQRERIYFGSPDVGWLPGRQDGLAPPKLTAGRVGPAPTTKLLREPRFWAEVSERQVVGDAPTSRRQSSRRCQGTDGPFARTTVTSNVPRESRSLWTMSNK